jgi:Fis family transcriptional regulator
MKDSLISLAALMHRGGIAYEQAVREFKKRYILHVLNANKGNQCKAARELEMHRNTLSRTIRQLHLVRNGRMYMDSFEAMRKKENGMAKKPAALSIGAGT